jgi:hypothetical protein
MKEKYLMWECFSDIRICMLPFVNQLTFVSDALVSGALQGADGFLT